MGLLEVLVDDGQLARARPKLAHDHPWVQRRPRWSFIGTPTRPRLRFSMLAILLVRLPAAARGRSGGCAPGPPAASRVADI